MSTLVNLETNLSYEKELDIISDFVSNFTPSTASGPQFKPILQSVANREINQIVVELDDVARFENTENGLAARITRNAKTYLELFSYTFDAQLPPPTVELGVLDDVADVIMHQRRLRDNVTPEDIPAFPPLLTRRYTVVFKPLSHTPTLAVRELKGKHVGQLLVVRGIVTRVSDVKPLLVVNAYSCESCRCEIFQEVKNKTFLPLVECPSEECKKNRTKGKLQMQTRASKFLRFQEVKVQEMADQVPVGHTPRSTTIHLYEGLTRTVNPGDIVNISGIFLTAPFTGFKAIRAGLLADTFVMAQFIQHHKKSYDSTEPDEHMVSTLNDLLNSPDPYSQLANSIAPEIYGHDDVKKAILLLLVGGGTRTMSDGMRIRGDINICLMGDPGVAKSQLLKFITKVAPRAVYTTGRGSSGVGLTAAVMRDPVTDEFILEGGALVLADNGICCIDEFDKMDESDRTAIHEVMEQQTISISKAGINTTLNARTSILAAANPAYGRYNVNRSPAENINLPAALLSRFDMIFLMLDMPNRDDDRLLAHHVTQVHMTNAAPATAQHMATVSPNVLRHYIALARRKEAHISSEVVDFIVSSYVNLRKLQAMESAESKGKSVVVTPRSLLGIIRLSQALARIRLREEVKVDDVNEALRLLDSTKIQVEKCRRSNQLSDQVSDRSSDTMIYGLIRDLKRQANTKELSIRDIKDRILLKGFNERELDACLDKYMDLNIWLLNESRTKLSFVVE